MKILIWRSCYDTKIYCAESEDQLISILNSVIDSVDGFCLDEQIKKVQEEINSIITEKRSPTREEQLRRSIFMFVRDHIKPCDSDSFQEFIFDSVEY